MTGCKNNVAKIIDEECEVATQLEQNNHDIEKYRSFTQVHWNIYLFYMLLALLKASKCE